ncbi:MAG TPA: AlpA family phage regulatory protein [Rhodanobacteraceae bacterium]|jgi:predicted DNA-binding transcriptional regulator AlpA|nr:AlpA family phage regulatory protein [Rhodanobacteraceae bacterium]
MQRNTQIPETGFLRLPQVLALIPVCKTTWWNGVRSGRYPQPTRALGKNITAWRVEDIRALIDAAAPKAAA